MFLGKLKREREKKKKKQNLVAAIFTPVCRDAKFLRNKPALPLELKILCPGHPPMVCDSGVGTVAMKQNIEVRAIKKYAAQARTSPHFSQHILILYTHFKYRRAEREMGGAGSSGR